MTDTEPDWEQVAKIALRQVVNRPKLRNHLLEGKIIVLIREPDDTESIRAKAVDKQEYLSMIHPELKDEIAETIMFKENTAFISLSETSKGRDSLDAVLVHLDKERLHQILNH